MPQPWETWVWSSVKDETQAHRKLAFIICRAQGAICFLFNSNSCTDWETNVPNNKNICNCSKNSLYLFTVFILNLILKWPQSCLTRWGNTGFPSFTLCISHMGMWTFLIPLSALLWYTSALDHHTSACRDPFYPSLYSWWDRVLTGRWGEL